MIWDRLIGYVIRVRGILTWWWPFMVATVVTCNMIVLPLLVVRQAQSMEETREASVINRRLIERGNPCLPGDDPSSEACLAERLASERLAEALAAVQAQHDAQALQINDAVNRLIELQERNHGVAHNAGSAPRVGSSSIARIPAPPRATTTTTAPPPPTTVCPERGKRPKECR